MAAQILPVDQIKAGMKGKGRTVLSGNKIEEFNVEILGILHNWQPKKDLILARLDGGPLERTGVMEGMSGSPVYIDGKLIGAISYSIAAFPKDALSGITPIEEMLKIEERELSKFSFSTSIPVKKHMTLDDLFEIQKDFFNANSASVIQGQTLTPLSIPLVFSGFSPKVIEKAVPFFTRIGFTPISAGLSGQALNKVAYQDLRLRGGDAVGAQLISGDMEMTAVGTVTYVEGDKVLAFGHPLYNLGGVEYIMTKANILTLVPSLQTSSKLAVTDIPVGRFTQDRNAGIFGELGKSPKLIPLNIRLINDQEEKTYTVNVVEDKILTPSLVNVIITNILYAEERAIGDLSLDVRGTVFLENGMNIRLEDLFSGNYDTSATNLSSLVASIVFYLTSNEFRDLSIHRIDLAIRAYEGVRVAFLEKVMLDKYDVSAKVVLTGEVSFDDLVSLYLSSHLVVVPSTYEGFGIVVLEAGACGRPVIASDIGGLNEAVVDGETGFLVDVKDPSLFAATIVKVLSDDPLRRQLGENARGRVLESFTWDRICSQVERIYEAARTNPY